MTLGVLWPWTGQATRDWIMEQVAGGDGDRFGSGRLDAGRMPPPGSSEP